MVLKTFEVQDLKHLLDDHGHDPLPFIEGYIEIFRGHSAAIKIIMYQDN